MEPSTLIPSNSPVPDQNNQLLTNSLDEKSGSHFPLGLITILCMITILFILIFIFFTQNSKVSATDFSSISKNSDYSLNQVYLIPSTINWKEYNYQKVNIRYPSDWNTKSYDLGRGDLVMFSKVEQGYGSSIFFGELSHITSDSCDQYLQKSAPEGDLNNNPANNQNSLLADKQSETLEIQGYLAKANLLSTKIQGYTSKTLTLCFNKNGIEYGAQLLDNSADNNFKEFKNFILLLNSLKFD